MKNYILLVLCVLSLASCRKETASFDGTSIEEQYSNFTVLEPFSSNKDSVAFAAGESPVGQAGQANAIVRAFGNRAGDVRPVTVAIERVGIAVDEVVAADELRRREVR